MGAVVGVLDCGGDLEECEWVRLGEVLSTGMEGKGAGCGGLMFFRARKKGREYRGGV